LPQRTVSATPTQPIDFGLFYVTSAGTITVNWQGSVSTTGGVVVVSSVNARPAIFDIKLCQGRNVTLTYNPTTTITNGATSITLTLGDTEKGPSGATFAVNTNCTFITTLRVGGTLDIPDGAATGVYTGSFSMNFTQG
jgi:S-formylglutathione hydrolase FrmB